MIEPVAHIPDAMFAAFPDFEWGHCYVQVPEHSPENAGDALTAAIDSEFIGWLEDYSVTPIWMRHTTGEEAEEKSGGEFEDCWLECQEITPGAKSFYKVEAV